MGSKVRPADNEDLPQEAHLSSLKTLRVLLNLLLVPSS